MTRDRMDCPACGARDTWEFYRVDDVPTNSMLLLDDPEEARSFPVGTVALRVCEGCGFIYNGQFDEAAAEYSQRYEASQAYSPTFNSFARSVAQRWADRYVEEGDTIVEIGADKGDFLALLCEISGARGIGIDPASDPARQSSSSAATRLSFLAERFHTRHAELDPDVIVCRHTLEHIADVRSFMSTIRASLGDRTDIPVLFEIPDTERVLEKAAFWDVYYEHCSYFTPDSVRRLFETTGFEVLGVDRVYGDQYLLIEALPSARSSGHTGSKESTSTGLAREFGAKAERRIHRWSERLREEGASGNCVALWGGGSKAVAVLTALHDPSVVHFVVDINPHKQGRLLPRTGHRVTPPEELPRDRKGVVVLMNPNYRDEVAAQLSQVSGALELLSVEDPPTTG